MIKYLFPNTWITYDSSKIAQDLAEAKSTVLSLRTVPYQLSWVEKLQEVELKREVAGTSRIEGADFTERELDEAIKETPEQLKTRSQRQAHAAVQTYRWIATVPDNRPLDEELILEIHRRIIRGADDDHCPPGKIRAQNENVNFGQPRHRGVEGGEECKKASLSFSQALQREYRNHDMIIQALAAHYHLASMHLFLDGNGRTARALEALILQRAGLRHIAFIAMSNYYYDEKMHYLSSLNKVREQSHDLTQFLAFGLRGIALQSRRLLKEIQHEISKVLFRNLMYDLFNRLKTPRKRVIVNRQMEILKLLLDKEQMKLDELIDKTERDYKMLRNPLKALVRDINELINLGAVKTEKVDEEHYIIHIRLDWPTQVTQMQFFERLRTLPRAKTYSFLK